MFLNREEFKLAPFEVKSWPHLVGTPLDEAVKEIRREHPGKSISPRIFSPFPIGLTRQVKVLTRVSLIDLVLYFRVPDGATGTVFAYEDRLETYPCTYFLRRGQSSGTCSSEWIDFNFREINFLLDEDQCLM